MGKVYLFLASIALLVTSTAVSAQTRSRFADNFDMANGVKIYTPATPTAKMADKPVKKKTEMTVSKVKPIVMMGNINNVVPAPTQRMSAGKSLGSFTTGDATFDSYIATSAAKYNVDPLLIYAQMNQESGFKRGALSHKGASGLMQLMPATARRFGVTNIFDPQQNIDAGVKYMRWLLNTFNQDVRLALAGYNAGEGAVMKYGNQIPPYRETQHYVARITARYAQIRNPNFVPTVNRLARTEQVAKVTKKEEQAATIYVPSAQVERLPGGRIRLVTQ